MFDKICEKIEVAEKDYFGLRYIDEKDGQVLYIVFFCLFFLTLLLLGMSQKKFLMTVSLHFHTDR